MADLNGFTDLRIGHGAQGVGDDSVWPSFTDVMTVIVMIFLMALVVIMVRNFELDRQLISTITNKQAAETLNKDLSQAKSLLEVSLESTQGERDQLKLKLSEELDKIALLTNDQAKLETQLSNLVALRQQLESANSQLSEEKQQANQEIIRLVESEKDLSQAKSLLETSLESTQGERDQLKLKLSEELDKIALLTNDQAKLETQLSNLVALRQQLESANSQLSEEKQQANQEITRLVESEKDLNNRITRLSQQLSELEIQSSQEISALSEDKQTLGEKLDTVSIQLLEVKVLLEKAQAENFDLSREVTELQQTGEGTEELYSIATDEIRKLLELIKIREAENAALQAQADTSTVEYRSLQQEYDSLDEKYRDLIRPARSTAGKVVVNVWLEKQNGAFAFKIRKPDQSDPVYLLRSELEAQLADLKAQHGQALYTRIIIPGESNISYNDAWDFTQDILNKYDYYYQQ